VEAQENKAIGADVGGAGVPDQTWLPGPPPPLNTLHWAKHLMRSHVLVLFAVFVFANLCRCQEKGLTSHSTQGTESLSSLEASLVGTWRLDFPEAVQDGTNVFLKIQLSANRRWHWSVFSDNPRTDPNEESGTWFVHERALLLRIAETKTKMFEKGCAWAFDIKSVTPQTLVVTNTPFGDRTWTRIAQQKKECRERGGEITPGFGIQK